MYASLFRGVIFPALDAVNRTSIGRVLRELEETERASLADLRELQRRKLDRLLDHVREHCPDYVRFWDRAPEERRAVSDWPALDGMPLVGKPELRSWLPGFPLPGTGGRVIRVRTSGSTGAPTTFLRSAEQESWFWALRFRCWRWAGFEMGQPYLALNLNARTALKKKLQDVLFRCTYLTYNADTQDSARIVSILRRRKISHINAFGSTLLTLARYMRDNAVTNPGVRVLTSTGDTLYPPQRQLIQDAFGVPVTDYYGAGGEGMHLASQCERGERYHIHMENSIVEVIRDGRPARPGEVGTIVVTQLDNRAMPLVRYELGDMATVADGKRCGCGRQHELLESIEGRACDMVHTPAGTVLLPQFFFIGPFKNLDGVARYQVIQEVVERITVRLVARDGCERDSIERTLRTHLANAGGRLEVDFEWVDEIPLAGLGKPRPVISKLGEDPRQRMSAPGQAERPGQGGG